MVLYAKRVPHTTHKTQTYGQSEVANRYSKAYFRCFSFDKPQQWNNWLSWAEYWYNTAHHSAIGVICLHYSRDLPPLLRVVPGATIVSSIEQRLLDRNAALDDLRMHLLRAQQRMKRYANTKIREDEFAVGDKVFLKLRPYR